MADPKPAPAPKAEPQAPPPSAPPAPARALDLHALTVALTPEVKAGLQSQPDGHHRLLGVPTQGVDAQHIMGGFLNVAALVYQVLKAAHDAGFLRDAPPQP